MTSNNRSKFLNFSKKGIIPLFISLLFGCSTLSLTERTYAPDGRQVLARDDGVEIQVGKRGIFWYIFYMNYNDEPKCVASTWEVFDLNGRITNRLIYVEPETSKLIGLFTEETWDFGNIKVEVGGSGYVNEFYAVDPYEENEDCLYPKGE